jgi:hypothetical protein
VGEDIAESEFSPRSPRAAVDKGGDADTDTDDLPGLSFNASPARSIPLPLCGLDYRPDEDSADDCGSH